MIVDEVNQDNNDVKMVEFFLKFNKYRVSETVLHHGFQFDELKTEGKRRTNILSFFGTILEKKMDIILEKKIGHIRLPCAKLFMSNRE